MDVQVQGGGVPPGERKPLGDGLGEDDAAVPTSGAAEGDPHQGAPGGGGALQQRLGGGAEAFDQAVRAGGGQYPCPHGRVVAGC